MGAMTDTGYRAGPDRAGMLAAAVASEFNDELTLILGQCEISLELIGGGHPAAEALFELQQAALRCAAITDCLLTFTVRSGMPQPARLEQVLAALYAAT